MQKCKLSILSAARIARRPCVLLCMVLPIVLSACETVSPVEPAAPTLVSVEGNGTLGSNQNGPVFRFHAPSRNPTTNVTVHPASTRVRVSVPYPSSIELAINGKPLAKVDPPLLTTNYVYAGAIDNPGQNPATWTTAIKTPFDIPYY